MDRSEENRVIQRLLALGMQRGLSVAGSGRGCIQLVDPGSGTASTGTQVVIDDVGEGDGWDRMRARTGASEHRVLE